MSGPPYCPTPCLVPIYFYKGDGFIGCATYNICPDSDDHSSKKSRSAKYDTFYLENGEFVPGANETECGTLVVLSLGPCEDGSSACAQKCPRTNLTGYYFSDIVSHVQPATVPSISSPESSSISGTRSSSTSHSQSFTPSTSIMYNEPAATTASQPALTNQGPPKSTAAPASKSNAAAIAGGVAGGVAGLALLVGLLFICRRRRKTKSQHGMSIGKFSAWNSGQPHFMPPSNAELQQIKQEPSTTSSPVPPPSAPPSPLLSPLPPPPAYASYNTHSNGLEGSPDHLHPSSGSPYVAYNVPSPESPPSPPPLKTRISQQSANSHSDGQDVSPISSHYQHQNFDNSRSMRSSVYSQVSGGVPHTHAM